MYSHHSEELKKNKTYSRSIQTSWYKKYPWISVCTTSYKIFCHVCRSAKYEGLLVFSKRQLNCFVEDGFSNWKNALAKLDEHGKCDMHREAVMKLAAKASSTHIGAQLNAQHSLDQKHHQYMLAKLLSSIRFLARQGLPLRGHHEGNSNLHRLLLLRAEDCSQLNSWVLQKEYTSPDIINEIIAIMGNTVLREILQLIRTSMWFSIIVDDVSRNEQMSLSIRWIDDNYQIYEEPIGLIQLPNTKAQTIYSVIKDLLIRCSLPLSQCRGQAFDGAGNMSGIKNGVQALIKKDENRALYVHCLAHNLNLCVQCVAKQCDLVRNAMDFIYELIQLIKFSPKRLALFNSIRDEVALGGETSPLLRSICPTRWTVRNGSINSVLQNYSNLITTLEEVRKGSDEYAAKGNGLLMRMESFDIFFGLKLAHLIFSASEQFSVNIQAKDISIQEATHGANLLVTHYQSLRTESKFDRFYDDVVELSTRLTDEPSLPRYRKRPKRVDEGAAPHCYQSPKERYRHIYFEVLELVKGEIERRFNQADFHIIQKLESLLLDVANGKPSLPDESLLNYLQNDVDKERLFSQVSDMIKNAFQHLPIKTVTNVRTIAEGMNQSDIYKKMLAEVDKMLKIYFTIPVTTATAERSFSTLRRLKTYLRSTMSQSRLNNLFILYVHTVKTDELDLKSIAREFVSVNHRRLNYFGKI